jgi:hypothetical protein
MPRNLICEMSEVNLEKHKAVRLSASSYGLQLYKVLVLSSELKSTIIAHCLRTNTNY